MKEEKRLTIKNILKFFGVVIVLLTLWVWINSQEEPLTTSSEFLTVLPKIPDEENAFKAIAFTQTKTGIATLSGEMNSRLAPHIKGEVWDSDFVAMTLLNHEDALLSFESSLMHEKMQLPLSTQDPYDLPGYAPILTLFRLVLLDAMVKEKEGNVEAAIQRLNDALVFSRMFKEEKNYFLISYLIGLTMQHETLFRIHMLSANDTITVAQLQSLQAVLDKLPRNTNDGFGQTFLGEYAYSYRLYTALYPDKISERWSAYWDDEGFLASYFIWGDSDIDVAAHVYRFLNVFFQPYYLHKNKNMNILLETYTEQRNRALHWCENTPAKSKEFDFSVEHSWIDIFKPNSLGMVSGDALPDFNEYFHRRCFNFAYSEAVRTVVALQQYQREMGEYPAELTALIPSYIKALPLDPYTNKHLHYSKKQGWLSSAGKNHQYDGGAKKAFYQRNCYEDNLCAYNPTFPISIRATQ